MDAAKPIRVAQIGCGYWGKNLVRNFSEIGALAAVSDLNPETTQLFADKYSVPGMSFSEVMEDTSIDAIALATPAPLHASQARLAMDHGKDVYLEKPLALNSADAIELKEQAEQGGHLLMVGHLLRYHPIFIKLLSLVKSDVLGDIQYVYSNRLSLGKHRIEENVLWSFAPHDISMILALVGEEPKTVTAQGAIIHTEGIEDHVLVSLGFSNGTKGHVQVSWNNPFKEQRLTVIGSKAMAVFEDSQPDWDKKLALYHHKIERKAGVPVPEKAEPEYIQVEKGEPLKDQCRHFVASLTSRIQPRTNVDEGLGVLRVLERAEAELAKAR